MSKKLILYFLVFITFIPLFSFANNGNSNIYNKKQSLKHTPFIIKNIEKEYNINISECDYDFLNDYDYTKLDDEKKLNYAIKKYINLYNIFSGNYPLYIDEENILKCHNILENYQSYLLDSINSIQDKNVINSKKYNFAYALSYLTKNGLYEYDKLMKHINKLGNISLKEIKSFYEGQLDENGLNVLENNFKVINFLKTNKVSNDNLKTGLFYEKIVENKLTKQLLFNAGNFDIFNSKVEIYSDIGVEGSGRFTSFNLYFNNIDSKVLNKFVHTFSEQNGQYSTDYEINYTEMLDSAVYRAISGQDDIFIFPFMERVYIVKTTPLSTKLYDIFLFTLDNTSENDKDHLFITNIENRMEPSSEFNALKSLQGNNLKEIKEIDVLKNADKSPFISNRKALLSKEKDEEAYNKALHEYYKAFTTYIYEYLESMPGMTYLIPSKFYKFDIDNDKKDELLAEIHLSSTTIGESGIYTVVLNEKTLELEDSELNNILISFMGKEKNIVDKEYMQNFAGYKINTTLTNDDIGTGFVRNFYQKIYTENGKNKIALVDDFAYGIYIDILCNKNNFEINANPVYKVNSKPQLVWSGKTENGKPVGLLNTDASFDMSKASTPSELAIVNDVNLRMLDRLSSDKYFKEYSSLSGAEKEKKLQQRRKMNKEINKYNGDNKCIKDILYNDVFNKN